MKKRARSLGAVILVTGLVALAGCSAAESGGDDDGSVTITIGNLPSTEQAASRDAILAQIKAFQKKYPDITVEAEETYWDPATFNAMVAGGTMPTVLTVPMTEIQSLGQRGQIADISAEVSASETLSALNPTIMTTVTGPEDEIFGIPINVYSQGLMFNRAIFEEAGLDPDAPPTTWAEVASAAKTITDKTGVPGLVLMTSGNLGGWTLTGMTYAFGDLMETSEDGTPVANVDNDSAIAALEFIQDARWKDNSLGANFIMTSDDSRNEFGAGRAGIVISGTDLYGDSVVNRGMDPQDFGLAPMPQAEGGLGALGGGNVQVVSATASAEQRDAATKWIDFAQIARFTDEDQAVAAAKAESADGLPVGAPGLPLVGADLFAQYNEWIAPYVNVPTENFELYASTVETIPLVPEPSQHAQELYAALDPVVQAVLTREDADIRALLGDVQTQMETLLAD